MSDEQLRKLKRSLRAVQGETWEVKPGASQVTIEQQTRLGSVGLVVAETHNPQRAAFIAACDPQVVAELIELAERGLQAA